MRRGFARGLLCQAPREGAPRSVARGTREAGAGSEGDATTAAMKWWGMHPATGSHLPAEETAPPSAVAPFASLPFAHPIPQSRCRAHDDLFRGSLKRILRYDE